MNISDILLVGDKGRMARLIADRAKGAGIRVRGVDQPLTADALAEGVRGADMVLLCVPVSAIREVSRQCAAVMTGGQILADICSVKVQPLADMREEYSGPVVGTHPLFGPDPSTGDDRVAVTPAGDDEAAAAVSAFVEALGFTPFLTTAEEHDEAMACIQGLNFVTTVAYLATLAHRPELDKFVTPSFKRRLEASRKMLTEDSTLFAAIMEANPSTQDTVRKYRSLLNIAAGGDIDLLCQRANWWWWRNDTHGGDA